MNINLDVDEAQKLLAPAEPEQRAGGSQGEEIVMAVWWIVLGAVGALVGTATLVCNTDGFFTKGNHTLKWVQTAGNSVAIGPAQNLAKVNSQTPSLSSELDDEIIRVLRGKWKHHQSERFVLDFASARTVLSKWHNSAGFGEYDVRNGVLTIVRSQGEKNTYRVDVLSEIEIVLYPEIAGFSCVCFGDLGGRWKSMDRPPVPRQICLFPENYNHPAHQEVCHRPLAFSNSSLIPRSERIFNH